MNLLEELLISIQVKLIQVLSQELLMMKESTNQKLKFKNDKCLLNISNDQLKNKYIKKYVKK